MHNSMLYPDTQAASSHYRPTHKGNHFPLILLTILTIACIVASMAWLQWASQRGLSLGYPKPRVHVTLPASGSLLLHSDYQFTANGTGRNLMYTWDFGDQSLSTDHAQTTHHIYKNNGSYRLVVTATDGMGNVSQDAATVHIIPPLPQASFIYQIGFFGISFDASASTADPSTSITNYHWDFGDGKQAVDTTFPQTSYYYAATGSYRVTLIVTDATGQQSKPYITTLTIA